MLDDRLNQIRQFADTIFILQESGKLAEMDRAHLESLLRTTHFQIRHLLDCIEGKRPSLNKTSVMAYIKKALDAYTEDWEVLG